MTSTAIVREALVERLKAMHDSMPHGKWCSLGALMNCNCDYEENRDTLVAALAALDATPGEGETWLSGDDAEVSLWQAIEAIKLGNKTDDKLILENLRSAGIWLARFEPLPTPAQTASGVEG